MSRAAGPSAGTVPRMALEALYDRGGALSVDGLKALVPPPQRASATFQIKVVRPLEKWQMAFFDASTVHLTQSGYAFVRSARATLPAPTAVVVRPVPSRAAPEFRELAPGALRAGGPRRPGMDDYKQIPSLFCGKRVMPGGATE